MLTLILENESLVFKTGVKIMLNFHTCFIALKMNHLVKLYSRLAKVSL